MEPPTILIVDDDPGIRETVGEILAFEGYRVRTAPDVELALGVLATEPIHVVLLDMRIAGGGGGDLVRQVRRRPSPPRIVILSAAVDAEQWAQEIAADGCIEKPFGLEDFLVEVARLCQPDYPSTLAS